MKSDSPVVEESRSQSSVVQSAGIVSAATLVSRITGLAREMVMARLFGAGQVYDAFQLGYRIPSLTRDLVTDGALASAFIPIFTQRLSTENRRDAVALSNLMVTTLILVVGAFCIIGMIFSPALVRMLAPGFSHLPGKPELAVTLMRIMFPFVLLVSVAAQAMGMLNACNQFAIPTLSSTFFNIGSVVFGLALGYLAGPWLGFSLIVSMAYGVLIGGAIELISQLPSLKRQGFDFHLSFDFSHPGLRSIMRLIGPAILGNAAVHINVIVNMNIASGITDASGAVVNGPVSWLAYASRFIQLPLGLFGVAIASATLPALSRIVAVGGIDEFRDTLSRSLGIVFLLTIPSSVGLTVLGDSMIGTVYEWGKFRAFDTHQTALALSCYAVGLSGYAAIRVLAPALYALNEVAAPMLVSLASILINLAAAISTVKLAGLGHLGIALSTSAVALFGSVVLFWMLRRRLRGLRGHALASSLWKISLASAVMGATCYASSHTIRQLLHPQKLAYLADVAISIPLGVIVAYVMCRTLRVPELTFITSGA